MIVRGVTEDQLRQAAKAVGVTFRHGIKREGRGYRFTLAPLDGRYQRRSARGRKVHAVCWHGHYDFFEELFTLAPDAIVITSLVRYDGEDDFYAKAEGTGGVNIGTWAHPVPYDEACECFSSESNRVLTQG